MIVIEPDKSHLLCLYSTRQFVPPFSCQGNLRIVIRLSEFYGLWQELLGIGWWDSQLSFTQEFRERTLLDYEANNSLGLSVVAICDLFYIGISELKRASSRNKDATPILLDFESSCRDVKFSMAFEELCKVQLDDKILNTIVNKCNEIYNTIGISVSTLSEHNRNYFAYLVLLQYNCERTLRDRVPLALFNIQGE